MVRLEGTGARQLAFVTLVMAVTLGACGGGSGDAEERDVEAAFADLQERFAAHDPAGVCSRITDRAQRQVGSLGHEQPTTCERDIRRLFEWIATPRATSADAPELVAARVDGNRAIVRTALSSYARGEVPFVKQDGQWRLDNFFGVTAPPPPDLQ